MKSITKQKRGQGMTEYIIIVALIAIATIVVISLFGNNIRTLFGMSTDALRGTSTATNRGAAANRAEEQKNLTNFGDQSAAP